MRCVSWETSWRKGALSLTSLRNELAPVDELIMILQDAVFKIKLGLHSSCDTINVLVDMRGKCSGDAREALQGLLDASFEPLASMLIKYVSTGCTSDDIYSEVFRDDQIEYVPKFMNELKESMNQAGLRAQILTNALGKTADIHSELLKEVKVKPENLLNPNLAKIFIEEVTFELNKQLYCLVNSGKDNWIQDQLNTVKKFFFLGQSNWFRDLVDIVQLDEFNKPITKVNSARMNDAIKRVTNGEVNGISFECDVGGVDSDSHIASRALSLEITCKTKPLELIFSKENFGRCQRIFRSIVYCRLVSMQLSDLWIDLQLLRMCEDGMCDMLSTHLLLRQMLHFVDNYMLYQNMDVIEPNLRRLEDTIQGNIHDVLDLERQLAGSLDRVIDELAPVPNVQKLLYKLLTTCSLFCTHMKRFLTIHMMTVQRTSGIYQSGDGPDSDAIAQEEKYQSMIKKYIEAFQSQMNNLSVQLIKNSHTASSVCLFTRLDFNEYFSETTGIQY